MYGFESWIKTKINSLNVVFRYSRTETKADMLYFSKYLLNYPLSQFSFNVDGPVVYGLTGAAGIVYRYRTAANN